MMRATTNTGPAKRSRPATFEFEALEGLQIRVGLFRRGGGLNRSHDAWTNSAFN